MANEYATRSQLKVYLGIDTDNTNEDTVLDSVLTAASRGIDNYCGRYFYADAVVSARIYSPRKRAMRRAEGEDLLIDDVSTTTGLIVATGVANGSTWTAITNYETYPENAIARGRPITAILRLLSSWGLGGPTARVQVTAKWGWPAIPDVVYQATLIQAARLFHRKDSPEGVLGSPEWGPVRLSRIDPDVQALVRPLVLPSFA
jgi:Phage gp6-like head-tail connector protein